MAARGAVKPAVRRDAMRTSTMKSGRAPLAIAFLWAATAVTPAATQQAEAPDMPAIAGSLPPPPVREAQAAVVRAAYPSDDLLWENDRTPHRSEERRCGNACVTTWRSRGSP